MAIHTLVSIGYDTINKKVVAELRKSKHIGIAQYCLNGVYYVGHSVDVEEHKIKDVTVSNFKKAVECAESNIRYAFNEVLNNVDVRYAYFNSLKAEGMNDRQLMDETLYSIIDELRVFNLIDILYRNNKA